MGALDRWRVMLSGQRLQNQNIGRHTCPRIRAEVEETADGTHNHGIDPNIPAPKCAALT
jgi:hypothetical protein